MANSAVFMLLMAMAGSWLCRALLLRRIRTKHPDEFAALGSPSDRQLTSLLPRHQEMHIRFWTYLWGGKVFLIKDRWVSGLALLALISDTLLAGSMVFLFWVARQ